jgi:ADP-ribose pyrophosphatase YjhB (NUDIX family)
MQSRATRSIARLFAAKRTRGRNSPLSHRYAARSASLLCFLHRRATQRRRWKFAQPYFDDQGRILKVRETADGGRWTLPGGWADVNVTASENVVKEVREESGYDVAASKLAAVWDRTRQAYQARIFLCYKMFFLCKPIGGAAATGIETSEVGWLAVTEVPDDLSPGQVTPSQIRRMFEHWRHRALPTDYD